MYLHSGVNERSALDCIDKGNCVVLEEDDMNKINDTQKQLESEKKENQ